MTTAQQLKQINENALSILTLARARITDPKHWGKGENFMEASGGMTDINHACRFCAYGALRVVAPKMGMGFSTATDALGRCCEGYHYNDFIGYNDDPSTTHDDVLNLFDRAIALKRKDIEKIVL